MASRGMSERDFHHPFTPYEIQKQYMSAVYDCLEGGKVGIFESPTGTGKSLSLICGSLTWLRDHKRKTFEDGVAAQDGDTDEPDWIVQYAQLQKRKEALQRREDQEARLTRVREKEERVKARYDSGEPTRKRQKLVAHKQGAGDDDDAAFLLDDYESDDGAPTLKTGASIPSALDLSSDTQALMDKLGLTPVRTSDMEDREPDDELKIFFCSRTHSQLSQFANELRRVKMPPALSALEESHDQDTSTASVNLIEGIKHLTLGSRKNLCINAKVKQLNSATAINERCLELQQSSTSAEHKCDYVPNKENEALVNEFRDHALARIRDIEDFGKLGKRIGICPYYASRAAIKPTEIVTLPYPLLLQKSAREALNLSLKNHVVIIDEAHNLMDAIANLHSTSVTLSHLKLARGQLGIYLSKFRNKLKGKNRVYVTQLIRVIDSLTTFLVLKLKSHASTEGQAQSAELMTGKGMDQVNLYKLTRYVQESKIARKVERYLVHMEKEAPEANKGDNSNHATKPVITTPVLTRVQTFLMALTNPDAEGRFFFSKEAEGGMDDVTLKYLLLDPTEHFKEIVEEARAVVLAGGTMSPMDDYLNHLFHYLPLEDIQTLSCGHVIPPSSLLAVSLGKGPSGFELDCTFEKRGSTMLIDELGQTILKLAQEVPDGLVVFFPSYAYLDSVIKQWQKPSGSRTSVWSQVSSYKSIFLEPKSTPSPPPTHQPVEASNYNHERVPQLSVRSGNTASADSGSSATASKVENLLTTYSKHIHSADRQDNGALLLAVIGGSLSEGINFSDRLGRGVVVVGLPFPNARSAEWQARLEFVAKRNRSVDRVKSGSGKGKGEATREYLENVTMRAVNQCIGRAIRHKDDYAAIVLLDRRYERENIRAKLPGWIQGSLKSATSWNESTSGGRHGVGFESTLRAFFAGKKG